MSFIEEMKQKARQDKKTIVLPESTDIRTLEATQTILEEDYANVVLVGNKDDIISMAKQNN